MKTFGPEMPPRNPAAAARETARLHFRMMLRHHLELQAKSAADGVLECLRTAGVVLLVMDLAGVHATSFWLVGVLVSAPQLFGLGVLVAVLSWRRYVRWRVAREVR